MIPQEPDVQAVAAEMLATYHGMNRLVGVIVDRKSTPVETQAALGQIQAAGIVVSELASELKGLVPTPSKEG